MNTQWKALTNHTKMEECGEHWTAVQGPDWAFDVHTPPCVGKIEHHAVVEGIATAINCHGELIELLQDVIVEWKEFDNDESVSGADLVDWFVGFRLRVKIALAKAAKGGAA